MADFDSVPIRVNGTDIEAGWFNALRSAGLDQQGSSGSGTIVRNTPLVDLATVVVDESAELPSFIEVEYAYNRDHADDDTDVLRQRGIIRVPYESPYTTIGEHEFTATQSDTSLGFTKGVTFSITANLAGSLRTIGVTVTISDSGAVAPTVQGNITAFIRKVFI